MKQAKISCYAKQHDIQTITGSGQVCFTCKNGGGNNGNTAK